MNTLLKRLVLTVAICSPVNAAAEAPSSTQSNIQLPPSNINFDLSDLQEADKNQRAEWSTFQINMANAFKDTEAFTTAQTDSVLKVEAWARFLDTFAANNPFSEEDDSMRASASERLSQLEDEERYAQAEWARYQQEMNQAYEDTVLFLKQEPDVTLQIEALERFLETFSSNNPMSEEDDTQRKDAEILLQKVTSEISSPQFINPPANLAANQNPRLFFGSLVFNNPADQSAYEYIIDSLSDDGLLESSTLKSATLVKRYNEDENALLAAKVHLNHALLLSRSGLLGDALRHTEFAYGLAKSTPDNLFVIFNAFLQMAIYNLNSGQTKTAESALLVAQHLMNRNQELIDEYYSMIANYMTAIALRLGSPIRGDQEQLRLLWRMQKIHGEDSVELLPTLRRLGSYFASRGSTLPIMFSSQMRAERDRLFKNSIRMYESSIDIIEQHYGYNDLRLIQPLRGLASARMLEITGRRYAEEALLRSLDIARTHPDGSPEDHAQALIDLGDLYVITSDSKASETYLSAWAILQTSSETQQVARSVFGAPVRLFPREQRTLFLDRRPDAADPGEEIFIELSYDITVRGKIENIRILDSNVPNDQVRQLRSRLKGVRYRPRIENGELVSTRDHKFRQRFEVLAR